MKINILILLSTIVFFVSGCVNKEYEVIHESPIIENSDKENQPTEQNYSIDEYMKDVNKQSDIIKYSLIHDELTQLDMNLKSQELYDLWDETLNYLWGELKNNLSEEDFSKLLDEQREWIAKKENVLNEVGKEFEDGSIYSLIVNEEAARLTEERSNELYKILKSL